MKILKVLALATALLGPGCGVAVMTPDNVTVHPMQIESVDVLVAESLPVQVSARVQGIIPDGCSRLGSVSVLRAGNAITLDVLVARDSDGPCIQVIGLYDQVHRLPGEFPPGRYKLTVNGVVRDFVI